MSNLFKNSYVVDLGAEKRVINYNDRFDADNASVQNKAAMEAEFARREEMIDGFLAGIEASEVEVYQGPSAEEIVEQARREAEGLLVQARLEAEAITDEAEKKAEILFEGRKRDGYQDGVNQANQEAKEHLAMLEDEFRQKTEELEQSYKTRLETMEQDVVEAVLQVYNKVFGIQFDDKKQILLHLVKNTLLDAGTGKEFHIRVSQNNLKFVQTHIGEIKEKIGNDVQIEVLGDATLTDEACMIETEAGVFDCGIDTELSGLEKDIRSLCR